MTKEKLEQYRSIVAELDETRDRINSNTVSDTVTGSDSEFPYVKHSISIEGVKENEYSQKDLILKSKLEERKKEIEDFVDDIEDSLIRRIFKYRYMDGKNKPSWQWIAFKIGHYDEQYPRRKHNKYLRMKEKNIPLGGVG